MKEFKAESKRLLDLMINSIYTNKEIFLRELISNASDALDKQHFASLTDAKAGGDFAITLSVDKEARTLTISDNGCGMSAEGMEDNLSTIAKSGTFDFKKEHGGEENLIGQFGVGFYSAFMVSDTVTVISREYKSKKAYKWFSNGAEGYEIEEAVLPTHGTTIILSIKPADKEYNYDEFIDPANIEHLVKKYSDYIRYPIKMEKAVYKPKDGAADSTETEETRELVTLNSMVPIWKKPKGKVNKEEYESFYTKTFMDYLPPKKIIWTSLEGTVSYNTLLYIPSKEPFNYRSKEFKRGLRLYSEGVLIMENCEELLPEYLGFIRGLVDTGDISLNISREMLQNTRELKAIAASLEKKIIAELKKMLKSDKERKTYEEIFDEFGESLKFGIYEDYGRRKDLLKDILIFKSSGADGYTTLAEYVERNKDDKDGAIFYVCGDSVAVCEKHPKAVAVKSEGKEVLYLTGRIDEFVMKILEEYDSKKLKNVTDKDAIAETDEQKKEAEQKKEENKDLIEFIKGELKGKVKDVVLSVALGDIAVSVRAEGQVSLEMEKVFASMPDAGMIRADKVLELNPAVSVFAKMKDLLESDKETLKSLIKVLYDTALLGAGLEIANPAEYATLVQKLL